MITKDSEKIFKVKKIKTWSEREDEILKKMTKNTKRKNWAKIVPFLRRKTISDCISRYKTICFNQGPWSLEEDQALLKFHSVLGNNWSLISRMIKVRNWKQVRDRYINHLDPRVVHGTFSPKEDEKVYELYQILGNNWSFYLAHLPDRTADQIKNRFNSTIKQRLKSASISNL
jgi:hypothetical protein